MRVDLHSRTTGSVTVLSICRATGPTLLILMTCLSCSTPSAETSQPRYRVGGPASLFSDALTEEDNQRSEDNLQSAHRRLNAHPTRRQDQHKIPPSPKLAKLHAPIMTGAPAPRRASDEPNPATLSDAEKAELFQEFLEWRKRHPELP
jgi:hypothetical protein